MAATSGWNGERPRVAGVLGLRDRHNGRAVRLGVWTHPAVGVCALGRFRRGRVRLAPPVAGAPALGKRSACVWLPRSRYCSVILYTNKRRVPFQIDAADYRAVSRYRWHIEGNGYPQTTLGTSVDKRSIYLHAFLMGRAPDGLQWDHINRDKLDNRRRNLRSVTASANQHNKGLSRNNTSGAKGVGWDITKRKWHACIGIAGRLKNLGRFDTLEEAVAARLAAEATFWGENR